MRNRIYKVAAVAIAAGLISLLGYYERHGIRFDPNAMDQVYALMAEMQGSDLSD